MKNAHAGAIKGMSIAVIVLAALGIIGAILIMVFSGLLSAVVLDGGYGLMNDLTYEYGSLDGSYYDYLGPEDALFISIFMMLVGGGLSIWVLVCCIVTLIAGIFGVLHAANPAKLGLVMGWAIAGAILSFLGGSIVTVVLLIIVAVFANSDKRASGA